MYTLIIKDDVDVENQYCNMISLKNLTLETIFNYIRNIETKNSYFYEILKED